MKPNHENWLDVRSKGQGRIKDDSQVFSLSNWVDDVNYTFTNYSDGHLGSVAEMGSPKRVKGFNTQGKRVMNSKNSHF